MTRDLPPPQSRSRALLVTGAVGAAVAMLVSGACTLALKHTCQHDSDCLDGVCEDGTCQRLPDSSSTPPASHDDGGAHGVVGCGPTWADWPMPAPPSFSGMPDDARRNLPNPQSYDTSTPDIVIDRITGLVWQKAISPQALTFSQANAWCTGLELAGRDDWRLPSRIELVSLVDFSDVPSNIDTSVFVGSPAEMFWTCSAGPSNPLVGWTVDFGQGGSADIRERTASHRVRCVAGALISTPPPQRYERSAAGEVRDTRTGLVWDASVVSGAVTWGEAYDACLARGPGWRLPSVTELQTLIDEMQADSGVDRSAFLDRPDDYYWSGSYGNPASPWFVSIGYGNSWWTGTSYRHRARCVR